MINTKLENIRDNLEEIEYIKNKTSSLLDMNFSYPYKLNIANKINESLMQIQALSKEALKQLEDNNSNELPNEINVKLMEYNLIDENINEYLGHKRNSNLIIKNTLYDKIKEINFYNKNTLSTKNKNIKNYTNLINEKLNPKSILDEEDKEDYYPNIIDLHEQFNTFTNLNLLNNKINYITYLLKLESFISDFDNIIKIIKINKKVKEDQFIEYLKSLKDKLISYFIKENPLVDNSKILLTIETNFNNLIRNELYKDYINNNKKNGIFCDICNVNFSKETLYQCHLKGKNHLKKLNKLNNKLGSNNKLNNDSDNNKNLELICKLCFIIKQYINLLKDQIEDTISFIRRKQTMSLDEFNKEIMLEKRGENLNKENILSNPKAFNPKNVPIDIDGKPIPYWLFKIDGLDTEFKCEICGGASYWGRKVFETHFGDVKHGYGLSCLGIKNTLDFKGITKIEDALKLFKKIKEQKRE